MLFGDNFETRNSFQLGYEVKACGKSILRKLIANKCMTLLIIRQSFSVVDGKPRLLQRLKRKALNLRPSVPPCFMNTFVLISCDVFVIRGSQ